MQGERYDGIVVGGNLTPGISFLSDWSANLVASSRDVEMGRPSESDVDLEPSGTG